MIITYKTRYKRGRAFGFAFEWSVNRQAIDRLDTTYTRIGLFPPQRLYDGIDAKFIGYEKYKPTKAI